MTITDIAGLCDKNTFLSVSLKLCGINGVMAVTSKCLTLCDVDYISLSFTPGIKWVKTFCIQIDNLFVTSLVALMEFIDDNPDFEIDMHL